MSAELRYCPLCDMGYEHPTDTSAHNRRHQATLRKMRLICRYALPKANIKKFREAVPNTIITAITCLRFQDPDFQNLGFFDGKLLQTKRNFLDPNQPHGVSILSNTDGSFSIILLTYNEMHTKFNDNPMQPLKSIGSNDILYWMWQEGYVTKADRHPYIAYSLTTKGFAALAGCLDCDLICLPDDTAKYMYKYYAGKHMTERGD